MSTSRRRASGFQESRGLPVTGKLDGRPARRCRVERLPRDPRVTEPRRYRQRPVTPYPEGPEDQAKLEWARLSPHAEKIAERYHTTPECWPSSTLNWPTAPDRHRARRCGYPNVTAGPGTDYRRDAAARAECRRRQFDLPRSRIRNGRQLDCSASAPSSPRRRQIEVDKSDRCCECSTGRASWSPSSP